MNSTHPFARLHKQITNEYKKNNEKILAREKILNEKALKKKEKDKSRRDAICHICGRNTFNSMKQLKIHISKKHKK